MKTKTKLLYQSLLLPSLAGLTFFSQSAQAELDQSKYKVITERPSDTPGKIEVLEFFSYNCPHCMAVEPQVEKLAKELPEDVVVKPVPVSWNAGMEPLQRMYFTIQAIGHPELHGKVFTALQKDRVFKDEDSFVTWVHEQTKVDKKTVEDTMKSFGVTSKIKKATALAKDYEISGTPTFVVGGKYATSPTQAGGYNESVDAVRQLVEKVREESGAKSDKAADADSKKAAVKDETKADKEAEAAKAKVKAAAADAADKAEDKTDEVSKTAEEVKAKAEDKASDTSKAASNKVDSAKDKLKEKTDEVSKAAQDVKEKAEAKAREASDAASKKAKDAEAKLKEKTDEASKAAKDLEDKAKAKFDETRKSVSDRVRATADKLEGKTDAKDADKQ